MEHSDFVTKYRAGQVSVRIDKNKAGFMYEDAYLMPRNLRTKQALIRTVAFAGIPIGLVLYFFTPWWFATIVLVLSFFLFPVAQSQAASGVLKAALENPHIYQIALEEKVLVLQEPS